MNRLTCTVSHIKHIDSVHLVTFTCGKQELKMLSLELPHIKMHQKVNLIVKPTHVSVAKNFAGLCSFENILRGHVVDMERGKLLCNLKLKVGDTLIEALLTKEQFKKMDIKLHDELDIFIKASSLSILEVLDD